MKPKTNNLVAKHMRQSGSGRHTPKRGKHAPRNRQKQQWKKQIKDLTP